MKRPAVPARGLPEAKNLLRLSVAALVVATLAWGWVTRDQREIHGRLARIQRLLSKKADESSLSGLARVQETMRYISAEPEVSFGPRLSTLRTREEIAAVVLQARSSVTDLKVSIRDKALTIDPGRQSAVMNLTAEAVATYGGRRERDIEELELTWIKQDGRWVVDRARPASSIHRPPGL